MEGRPHVSWRAEFGVVAIGLPADCKDEQVRIDPDPDGAELSMLSHYLDYQRETMLSMPTAQLVSSW